MKILVIEDEPEMKELIKQFLEEENYVVEVADNFSSGMDKIVSYDYDCILLDKCYRMETDWSYYKN